MGYRLVTRPSSVPLSIRKSDTSTATRPNSFSDVFVGQGCHRETGVHDADPLFLVTHHGERSLDALPIELCEGSCLGFLEAMSGDELGDLSHCPNHSVSIRDISLSLVALVNWYFGDTSYWKISSFYY